MLSSGNHQAATSVSLTHGITSLDPRYSALAIPKVLVSVTDNDPEIPPVSLPFAYGGPWSPLPVGVLGSGIGTYSTSLGGDSATGSCRFDDSNDRLVIAFVTSPGALGYRLKGQPGSGSLTSGTFVVEESPDGVAWTSVRTIINKSNTDDAFADNLLSGSRFLAFTYLTNVSGNLQLDALMVGAGLYLGMVNLAGCRRLDLSINPHHDYLHGDPH